MSVEMLQIYTAIAEQTSAHNTGRAREVKRTHAHAIPAMVVNPGNGYLLTGLAPATGENPRILVLGSMPGVLSLKRGEYYANAQNRFWRVMEQIAGVAAAAPYGDRIAQLASAGIALWDTLKHCSRVGSLDSGIVTDTEVPNDIAAFLHENGTVGRIVFNGQKAARSFGRLVQPVLPDDLLQKVQIVTAPSTSPANARMDLPRLIESWRAACLARTTCLESSM